MPLAAFAYQSLAGIKCSLTTHQEVIIILNIQSLLLQVSLENGQVGNRSENQGQEVQTILFHSK